MLRGRRRPTLRRVLRLTALALAGWLVLSLVLFLVSAGLQDGVSSGAKRALDGGGFLPISGSTVLVLGSDARLKGTHERGANVIGQPSRSDTIMLLRSGGGHSARLSIPRDTVVDIPGHGPDKINAAYAIGGPELTIRTLKRWLGIKIDHLVEVNFANFPQFVDSLGGVDFTGGCIDSNISGGVSNGGKTLILKAGTHHLDGQQALTLARTRKNACKPRENDLDRVRRQQQLISAMKAQLLAPTTLLRLPWVAWAAPRAIRSDMGGPTLLGLATAMAASGSPKPRVLKPSGSLRLRDGQDALVVSDAEKSAAVKRFLNG